jgi:hypothetical protein
MLEKAYSDFAEAQGIIDVPPGIALCIAVAMITVPRAMSANGKKRIAHFAGKARDLILNKQAEII